jgi:Putative restriction endonuclease
MVVPAALHRHAFADYLALEETSNTKHEFLNGEIYAIARCTPEHAALSVAVAAALLSQLRGGPCRVYSSDLRIRSLATGLTTYPDVTVVCGGLQRDPESPTTVVNPSLVVEVTSDGTEAYDRGEMLEHHQGILPWAPWSWFLTVKRWSRFGSAAPRSLGTRARSAQARPRSSKHCRSASSSTNSTEPHASPESLTDRLHM